MTVNTISQLKNLNEISDGIHKRWILGNVENYHKSCDYLQKINYSIQDLNAALNDGLTPSMKDEIFVIALVDWIKEACECLEKALIPELVQGFTYQNEDQLGSAKKYFTAVRSFVVAHPLSTNRHRAYGLDGSRICVDIRGNSSLRCLSQNSDWYHLGMDGMQANAKELPFDFVLYIYDRNYHDMQFFQYVGCDFSDIFQVAESYIDRLYLLSKYLGKQKKRDWL